MFSNSLPIIEIHNTGHARPNKTNLTNSHRWGFIDSALPKIVRIMAVTLGAKSDQKLGLSQMSKRQKLWFSIYHFFVLVIQYFLVGIFPTKKPNYHFSLLHFYLSYLYKPLNVYIEDKQYVQLKHIYPWQIKILATNIWEHMTLLGSFSKYWPHKMPKKYEEEFLFTLQ